MLSPIIREQYIGSVEIRQVFVVSKVGKIAGSYVTKGIIKRGAGVRLLRDNIVIHEGKLKTLKRFKDDVKEVKENFECGIAFENYDDIKEGDVVEVFEIIQEKKQLL
jgi:translation initiation factor IF-2